MENSRIDNELKRVVYLCMIMGMTVLAVLLITLNRLLNWEVWMLPVIAIGTVICWSVYLTSQVTPTVQVYGCGFFSMFLVFYYCIRIKTLYDCSAVVVLMIFIFTFTREKPLIWMGILDAFLSLIFHLLFISEKQGLDVDLDDVVRGVMVFMIVPLSAFLVDRIVKAWISTEMNYIKQIKTLSDENERANNFLANVSHEVRTPISAVIGLSYVLEMENLPENTLDKVKSISAAGHRVAEQITDILDFTEIDMNKVNVTSENYMIGTLVNDLLSQLSQSDNYGLDLVIDIDPLTPATLIGDESKIKRILWHLIRNGYKFTKEGGVCVRIYPVKREYGINLVLEIKDTGVGMTEEEIENSYEKFYQVDSGRARTMGGLGLGVPIVNGLTKAMGGVFTIESMPNQGTVIRVSLPQKVADGRPCMSVNDTENTVAAGFLGFMATGHPKVREFYLDMISHMTTGLSIPFFRVQSKSELEKLISTSKVTHLFVGSGEYQANREYIDLLAHKMNVALVTENGLNEDISRSITILPKPFYGTQISLFLNHIFDEEGLSEKEVISFPGIRALVVDDEHMNLLVAREIFESYGMVITTASGGEEAINLCETQEFDVVFMDHMMPGMDGVEAMKSIKQNASRNRKEICVIALTANAISTAREMFMSEGFDGFIPKPIEIAELERVLKNVLPPSAIVYTKETDAVKDKKTLDKPDTIQEDSQVDSNKDGNTAQSDDPYAALSALDVDTSYGIDYCGGDKDFYEELLRDYADGMEKKLSEVQDFFENKDLSGYEIRVHGIKSTSKLIGAMTLSEKAKTLEFAAKEGNFGLISETHQGFMEDYKKLMETIKELFD